LLGAIYLEDLDAAMDQKNVHYVRYMDDWVILTKTRGHLQKLVKKTYKIMDDLKLTLHPQSQIKFHSKRQRFFHSRSQKNISLIYQFS